MRCWFSAVGCALLTSAALAGGSEPPAPRVAVRAAEDPEFCAPGPGTLCLGQDRFSVEIEWTDFAGDSGTASVLPFASDDSGVFWFFNAQNWELLVKVLRGCELNDHFWVFAAATTNVAYVLRVTDHAGGVVKEYSNPLGVASPAITDTTALPTCGVVGGRPQLLLFADPSTLSVGGTSLITALVRDAEGNPAAPGTRVDLAASLGTLDAEISTDAGGRAETIFTAGDQPGRAVVTASVDGAEPASVEITLLEVPSSELLVFANPLVLPVLGTATITVVARDANAIPVGAGRRIRLLADLGSIEREIVTDARGEAEAIFTAGDRQGICTVTALASGSPPARIELSLRDAAFHLELQSERAAIPRVELQQIELRVLVTNARGEPWRGQLVRMSSQRGAFDFNSVVTSSIGTATARLTLTLADLLDVPENGTFLVSAEALSEGRTLTASLEITVVGPP